MLSIFARLAAAERMPAQEQLQPRLRLPWFRGPGQAADAAKLFSFRTQ